MVNMVKLNMVSRRGQTGRSQAGRGQAGRGQISRGETGSVNAITLRVAAVFCLLAMVLVAGTLTAAAQEKITVAIMPFEASVSADFSRMDVGRQLTNIITDKLVNA